MTDGECLQLFGVTSSQESAAAIRQLLIVETDKERRLQGDAGGELMKLNCVQLFSIGDPTDALLFDAPRPSAKRAHSRFADDCWHTQTPEI